MTEQQSPFNPPESTGARLARLRRSMNITQEELAERLSISRQAVSKWESDLAYPETEKLLLLARLYGCTVDYLLTGETPALPRDAAPDFWTRMADGWGRRPRYFEFKSRRTLGGVPLVHVNIGVGRKAKGIVAVGLTATGVVSVGLASLGILSVGILSGGILSMGILSLGLLLAVGNIAVGTIAVGAIALGMLAIGALSVGLISVGGLALGQYVAVGDHARGMIALGQTVAEGEVFQKVGELHLSELERTAVEALLEAHCPPLLRNVAKLILLFLRT